MQLDQVFQILRIFSLQTICLETLLTFEFVLIQIQNHIFSRVLKYKPIPNLKHHLIMSLKIKIR
jgi:hypothetical protein